MLPLAQVKAPSPTGGLPPLPEGPGLDQLRPPPGAEGGPVLWQILLILLALLAFTAGLILLYRKQARRRTTPLSPGQAALAEIEAARRHASSDADLAALCSGAVRRLLFHEYNLPQPGLTHEEILGKLPLQENEKEALRAFFTRCDSVKFAGVRLPQAERSEILDTASQLIQPHCKEEVTQP